MSATRFRSQPPSPQGPRQSEPAPPAAGRRRLLTLGIAIAAAWSLALFLMDVWTANPLVVSRDQILRAQAVVIARRVAPGDDRVKVERVFHGNVEAGDILRVRNLNDLALIDIDRAYVLPLSPFHGDFVVTTLEGQSAAPIVYPASPSEIARVKTILLERL